MTTLKVWIFFTLNNLVIERMKKSTREPSFSFGKTTKQDGALNGWNKVFNSTNEKLNSVSLEDILKENSKTLQFGDSQFDRVSELQQHNENNDPNFSTANNWCSSTKDKEQQDISAIHRFFDSLPLHESRTPVIKSHKLASSINMEEDKTCNRQPFRPLDQSSLLNDARLGSFSVRKTLEEDTDFPQKTNHYFSRKKLDTLNYCKESYNEIKGVPFVLPKQITQSKPFNLSKSNIGSKVKRNWIDGSSPRNFLTKVDSVSKNQKWPEALSGEKPKRRSVSQEFKRDSKLSNQGYRVTFTQKPGERCILPLRTEYRAQSRCDQCHGHLESIPEVTYQFKARNAPHSKEFVLKKPVTKPTVPKAPKLNTTTRSQIRKEYEKRAEEYRRELKRKEEEEIERRKREKTSTFNLNF
jgi:hypothetical protein